MPASSTPTRPTSPVALPTTIIIKDKENDTPLAPSTANVKMAAVCALVHCAANEGWISAADENRGSG
jgi:hypothetical protein